MNHPDSTDQMVPCIEVREGVCGGEPCVTGTRISMYHLQEMVEMGWSYEYISKQYPHIDRWRLFGALSAWMNATDWRSACEGEAFTVTQM